MTLDASAFRRLDESDDAAFYGRARLVEHIDAAAIAAVTQLYREYFPAGGTLLDLMSSWVSHLPDDVRYARVVGHGMNAEELARNPRLDAYVVQNLNADPRLPFPDATFDGAAICVSIQYLIKPETVLRDVARTLKAGAPIVITFSNRCFPTKAVAAWHALDGRGHLALVLAYLDAAGGWRDAVALDRSRRGSDPLYAVVARATGTPGPEATGTRSS